MLSLRHRDTGEWTVVTATGDLDYETAPALREYLWGLLDNGSPNLILDLDHVQDFDTAGVGVIIGALRRARQHRGLLRLTCTREDVLHTFRLTGAHRFLLLTPAPPEQAPPVGTAPDSQAAAG